MRILCNRCEVDCNLYKNINYAKKCRTHRYPQSFKTPMLVHLLQDEDKMIDTLNILSTFDISIIETKNYPYFKLNVKGD
uniref:Uncharacterized protein n=1 Tax=viral metagenome TaxID=1070528 RepID=A0A6M3L8H1_9ZZZZ